MSKPFRSDKRKKELQRLKKQEEKRLRRFGLKQEDDGVPGAEETEGGSEIMETESSAPEGVPLADTSSGNGQPETKQVTE